MKKSLFSAAGAASALNKKPDEILEKWIEGVKAGDLEATAKLYLFCSDITEKVAYDVLKDAKLAKESSWETMELVVRLLRKGVDTGEFEPWLMWMARNVAISYMQIINREKGNDMGTNIIADSSEKIIKAESISFDEIRQKKNEQKSTMTPLILLKGKRDLDAMSWDPPEREDKHEKKHEDQCEALRRKMRELNVSTEYEKKNHIEESEDETDDLDKLKRTVFAKKSKRQNPMIFLKGIAMIALCTFLLWVIIGLLGKNMDLNIPDLGYSWFNSKLFILF